MVLIKIDIQEEINNLQLRKSNLYMLYSIDRDLDVYQEMIRIDKRIDTLCRWKWAEIRNKDSSDEEIVA